VIVKTWHWGDSITLQCKAHDSFEKNLEDSLCEFSAFFVYCNMDDRMVSYERDVEGEMTTPQQLPSYWTVLR